MKKLLLLIALLPAAPSAYAQTFTRLSLQRTAAADVVRFTVGSETNIRYYLLEGSRDSAAYETVSRIEAAGNSRLPRSYTASCYDTSYRYYRVRQTDITAGCVFSSACPVAAPAYVPAHAHTAAAPAITHVLPQRLNETTGR